MKLSTLTTLSLFALPAALAIACGSSSSSSTTGTPSSTGGNDVALSGTYAPTSDSVSRAEFASITFADATHYSYVKANCSSSCLSSGTYTFDGDSNLNLTDETTNKTEHVDFQATEVSGGGTSLTQSTHVLDGLVTGTGSGSGLVNSSGTPLTSGDGSSLIQQILQALMNGIMMALQAAQSSGDDGGGGITITIGDDGGDPSASCGPDVVAACLAFGGNFTSNSDGSCTCNTPDAGTPDAGDAGDAGSN